MRRAWLAAVLVAPLLAALLYALWPQGTNTSAPAPRAGEALGEGHTQPPAPALPTAPTLVGSAAPNTPATPASAPFAPSRGPEIAAARAPAQPDSTTREATGAADVSTPKAPPHPLDRDGIRGAIREKLPELRDCYESWLQQNPELGGTLNLSFQINAADGGGGVVQNITIIDGGVGHLAFEGCVANVFDSLAFEPPQNGAMNVTYPLVFSSTGAP